MTMNGFNGCNNNHFPPAQRFTVIEHLEEMDSFTVVETDDGDVVLRKANNPQEDLGTVDIYTLQSMLANGVDPSSLRISNGVISRLDGTTMVDKISSIADSIVNENSTNFDKDSTNN